MILFTRDYFDTWSGTLLTHSQFLERVGERSGQGVRFENSLDFNNVICATSSLFCFRQNFLFNSILNVSQCIVLRTFHNNLRTPKYSPQIMRLMCCLFTAFLFFALAANDAIRWRRSRGRQQGIFLH
jgi:hypothetical protein